MKRTRILYAAMVILIVFLGLLSRKISGIPLATGDALWALMIFFIVRFLLINSSIRLIALISLSICYLVETSQLYQAEWINNMRQTIPGRLILGQGFLWSDFLAYTIGVLAGFLIELILIKRLNTAKSST
ncbi:ribosomal maturation YjgA family protein [Pedobacter metabolipauper]|uniref:Uncharacterized protein DUF2809 n=1 Tax=Pedobacter metabolipauper TaxID=425513 RepID=A0A4R6SZZ4_9SPHI|nr:DUF2809 domain-containing protein [Pedobacter metabolipauper]TDQ11667.1 uncharacterized protein DUF2809 [Pedobacter metabolipauper]